MVWCSDSSSDQCPGRHRRKMKGVREAYQPATWNRQISLLNTLRFCHSFRSLVFLIHRVIGSSLAMCNQIPPKINKQSSVVRGRREGHSLLKQRCSNILANPWLNLRNGQCLKLIHISWPTGSWHWKAFQGCVNCATDCPSCITLFKK